MSCDGSDPAIPVLLIRGPSGVGKTTVAHEVSALLQERRIGHALIDTDELVRIVPPPPAERGLSRLVTRNVSALWANYQTAGARRLIIVGVIESLDADLAWIRTSVPDARFAVVRLRANGDALQQRLARRAPTADFGEHLRTSIAVGRRMDREAAGSSIVIETTDRAIREVAEDILSLSAPVFPG
jgi:broad-specificity NMP kinase